MRKWLTHLPAAETKRYVGNFLSVYRVRPAGEVDANSDDKDVDEPFQLGLAALTTALQTQTPAEKKLAAKAVNDDRAHRVEAALARADAWWKPSAAPAALRPSEVVEYASLDSAAAQKAARRKPAQPNAAAKDDRQVVPGSPWSPQRRQQKNCQCRPGQRVSQATRHATQNSEASARRLLGASLKNYTRCARNGLWCFGTLAMGFAWRAWYGEIAHLENGSQGTL